MTGLKEVCHFQIRSLTPQPPAHRGLRPLRGVGSCLYKPEAGGKLRGMRSLLRFSPELPVSLPKYSKAFPKIADIGTEGLRSNWSISLPAIAMCAGLVAARRAWHWQKVPLANRSGNKYSNPSFFSQGLPCTVSLRASGP